MDCSLCLPGTGCSGAGAGPVLTSTKVAQAVGARAATVLLRGLVLDDLVHAVGADGLDEGRNLVELLVIPHPLKRRSTGRLVAADQPQRWPVLLGLHDRRLPLPGQVLKGVGLEQRLVEVTPLKIAHL